MSSHYEHVNTPHPHNKITGAWTRAPCTPRCLAVRSVLIEDKMSVIKSGNQYYHSFFCNKCKYQGLLDASIMTIGNTEFYVVKQLCGFHKENPKVVKRPKHFVARDEMIAMCLQDTTGVMLQAYVGVKLTEKWSLVEKHYRYALNRLQKSIPEEMNATELLYLYIMVFDREALLLKGYEKHKGALGKLLTEVHRRVYWFKTRSKELKAKVKILKQRKQKCVSYAEKKPYLEKIKSLKKEIKSLENKSWHKCKPALEMKCLCGLPCEGKKRRQVLPEVVAKKKQKTNLRKSDESTPVYIPLMYRRKTTPAMQNQNLSDVEMAEPQITVPAVNTNRYNNFEEEEDFDAGF